MAVARLRQLLNGEESSSSCGGSLPLSRYARATLLVADRRVPLIGRAVGEPLTASRPDVDFENFDVEPVLLQMERAVAMRWYPWSRICFHLEAVQLAVHDAPFPSASAEPRCDRDVGYIGAACLLLPNRVKGGALEVSSQCFLPDEEQLVWFVFETGAHVRSHPVLQGVRVALLWTLFATETGRLPAHVPAREDAVAALTLFWAAHENPGRPLLLGSGALSEEESSPLLRVARSLASLHVRPVFAARLERHEEICFTSATACLDECFPEDLRRTRDAILWMQSSCPQQRLLRKLLEEAVELHAQPERCLGTVDRDTLYVSLVFLLSSEEA